MLQYHSFKVAQLALVGISLGLVWNSLAPLAHELQPPGLPAVGEKPAPGADEADALGGARYAVIQTRNLFKAMVAASAPVEAEPVEASRLDVKLLGTVESSTPEKSVGIVQDSGANSKVRVVGIGALLAEGKAKVIRIEQRKLVVDHEGRLESIETEKTRDVRTVSKQRSELRSRLDERRRLQESMAQSGGAGQNGQANQAAAQMDSNFSALVIQNIGADSTLAQVGLRPRDRIVAIDGIPMGQGITLPQMLLSFGESGAKVLEVERAGSKTQVSVPAERILELIQELGEKP